MRLLIDVVLRPIGIAGLEFLGSLGTGSSPESIVLFFSGCLQWTRIWQMNGEWAKYASGWHLWWSFPEPKAQYSSCVTDQLEGWLVLQRGEWFLDLRVNQLICGPWTKSHGFFSRGWVCGRAPRRWNCSLTPIWGGWILKSQYQWHTVCTPAVFRVTRVNKGLIKGY